MYNQEIPTDVHSIQEFDSSAFSIYGKVATCKDGIIEIIGLHDVMAGEVIVFVGRDVSGMIINLEKTSESSCFLVGAYKN
jgi:F0F1-type ATP synthase alpha subunit